MNRDEGFGPEGVGQSGPLGDRHAVVPAAGQDHRHPAPGQLDRGPAGHPEVDSRLGEAVGADGPRFVATVAGVEHHPGRAQRMAPAGQGLEPARGGDHVAVLGLAHDRQHHPGRRDEPSHPVGRGRDHPVDPLGKVVRRRHDHTEVGRYRPAERGQGALAVVIEGVGPGRQPRGRHRRSGPVRVGRRRSRERCSLEKNGPLPGTSRQRQRDKSQNDDSHQNLLAKIASDAVERGEPCSFSDH